ncbi:hypothetical protein [Streptomyces sp. GC420]|uniref:hypothetical protein n=1 Tax=Streptomyces sp. GC420 TaxID=2697568 RepID=UPI001414D58F|nr:hypothetical protein [Streptomyces sp. GC420]NBM16929.1 hypothetical protein [Streptomyces sp. GC420]
MHPAILVPGRPGHSPRPGPVHSYSVPSPLLWLGGVAAAFTVVQLILVVPGMGLGWDETVYVTQVARDAPAAFFSAPRARGITLLAAPVTLLTDSVTVLRVHLAVLSGCALFLALYVWRRLLPVPVLAFAGALWCTLWVTLFYGPQVMPNLWVAFGALFATGCYVRAVRDHTDLRALAGIGAGVAFVALMRPSDAVWLVLPLAAAALVVRPWRRPAVFAVLLAGAVVGGAEWVVEAYVRYGGLAARLERAGEIQGGMGWHPAFGDHVLALQGRTLCRPCDVAWRDPVTAVWWFALPLLTLGGLLAAVRARCETAVGVAVLTALSLGVPYLLMIDYAAPRFLLPVYLLLALPAALGLRWLATGLRGRWRPVAAAAVGLALAGHLAVQYAVLHATVGRSVAARESVGRVAERLAEEGVRSPCVVSGAEAVRVAHRAGCSSRQVRGHDGSISAAELQEKAETVPVAVMVAGTAAAPAYARGWRVVELPDLGGLHDYHAYLSPSARP